MRDSSRTPPLAPRLQPTLRAGEVSLRPWRDADVATVHEEYAAELAPWLGPEVSVPDRDRLLGWIRAGEAAYADGRREAVFAIEHDGAVAGCVAVRQRGDGVGDLSWMVFADRRRQGLATRAVRLLADYAFRDLGLVRVQAWVEVGDLASLRTAARAGLRREGVARSAETRGGRRADLVRLARLSDDPPPDSVDGFRGVLNAALPMKHVITQGLVRSDSGKVLLCELTYKREWDLPGGIVDPGESPVTALAREIHEELGLTLPNSGLRLANWLPPWRGWDDAMLFVFDLGVHPERLVAGLDLERREIRAVHWCAMEEATSRVAPYLAELLPILLRDDGPPTVYLERGQPPTAPGGFADQ